MRSKGDDFACLAKDMRENFKFRGGMDAHYFFYVVGERVADHEEWKRSRA